MTEHTETPPLWRAELNPLRTSAIHIMAFAMLMSMIGAWALRSAGLDSLAVRFGLTVLLWYVLAAGASLFWLRLQGKLGAKVTNSLVNGFFGGSMLLAGFGDNALGLVLCILAALLAFFATGFGLGLRRFLPVLLWDMREAWSRGSGWLLIFLRRTIWAPVLASGCAIALGLHIAAAHPSAPTVFAWLLELAQ